MNLFFRAPDESDDADAPFSRSGSESVAQRLARSRNLFPGGTYGGGNPRLRGGWVRF